jgi:F-type H+-transporting ATPase subunit b
MHALEEREERIAKRVKGAETVSREAQAKLAEYAQRIAASKDDAAALITAAKRDVEKARDEMLAAEQAQSAKLLEHARSEITTAKEAAVKDLREEIVGLTADLASRVMQREVNPETHRAFIQETMTRTESKAG